MPEAAGRITSLSTWRAFSSHALVIAGTCLASEQERIKGRFQELGHHHFNISTRSASAQRAFDRGLTLAYAFSHHRAEEEFRAAAKADPACAMAWWGVALVNGPHINEILAEPKPRPGFPLSRALWHYTRAAALNALDL